MRLLSDHSDSRTVVGQYILQACRPGQFQRYQIIGVMKDFNITSNAQAIDPVCFSVLFPGGGDQFATIRLSGTGQQTTLCCIEINGRSSLPPAIPVRVFTDRWNNLYASEMKTGKIFIIFSLLAILIACIGLIGLVTFMTDKRTKRSA